MPGQARILSIDAGGIRGLMPAEILATIERKTGRRIADLFHMVCGTSTGGILATGLCRPREPVPAKSLVDFYIAGSPQIFANSWWRRVRTLASFASPEFDSRPLESALALQFGTMRLSEVRSTDLLVTAYDIDRPDPYFFKSWKAAGLNVDPGDNPADMDFALRDVCRATSAAPTYFSPAEITSSSGKRRHFVDGVIFADNPAMCALHAAMRLYRNADSYLVVSLGTGAHQRAVPYNKAKSWGKLEWVLNRDIIDIVFDGVSGTVNYEIQQIFESGHVQGSLFRFETLLRLGASDPYPVSDNIFDVTGKNLTNLQHKARQMLDLNAEAFSTLMAHLAEERNARDLLL